jgi:DNA-binding IclR family transcriptional regulator
LSPTSTHRAAGPKERKQRGGGGEAGDKQSQYQIRAVERALQVLASFTPQEPELTLARLAEKTGLHKATILRLLRSLESMGFIRQGPRASYLLGMKVFELGSVYYITELHVERVARPWMERLTDRWQLTANLAVLEEGELVYIAIVEPRRALRVQFSVGMRFPVPPTALGKAILAGLDESLVDSVVARHGLPQRTPKSITTVDELKRRLAEVRERGYAVDEQESILNVRCVACPIHNFSGRPIAAMSLSGSILDLTEELIPVIAADLREACAAISQTLGAEPRSVLAPAAN